MDIYFAFDSAWTDNPKAPGVICAVGVENGRPPRFRAPELASFDQALPFMQEVRSETGGVALVAHDQPTVVPNSTGMRPVERVAASLIGFAWRRRKTVQAKTAGRVCRDRRQRALDCLAGGAPCAPSHSFPAAVMTPSGSFTKG